ASDEVALSETSARPFEPLHAPEPPLADTCLGQDGALAIGEARICGEPLVEKGTGVPHPPAVGRHVRAVLSVIDDIRGNELYALLATQLQPKPPVLRGWQSRVEAKPAQRRSTN